MTRDELIARSVYLRRLRLPRKPYHLGEPLFNDLEHYFISYDEEIGMVFLAGSKHEKITVFDPPRKWGQEFIDACQTNVLKGGC